METRPPAGPRVATGAAALVLGAAFTVTVASGSGTWTWPIVTVGGAGVVLVAVALAIGRAGLVGPALILLGAAYGLRLTALDPGLEGSAPLAAAALVATAELAYLSIALRLPVAQRRGLVTERVALVGAEALGAAVVAALVLAAAGLPTAGGATGTALGVVAAVIALGLVAWLARRPTASR